MSELKISGSIQTQARTIQGGVNFSTMNVVEAFPIHATASVQDFPYREAISPVNASIFTITVTASAS